MNFSEINPPKLFKETLRPIAYGAFGYLLGHNYARFAHLPLNECAKCFAIQGAALGIIEALANYLTTNKKSKKSKKSMLGAGAFIIHITMINEMLKRGLIGRKMLIVQVVFTIIHGLNAMSYFVKKHTESLENPENSTNDPKKDLPPHPTTPKNSVSNSEFDKPLPKKQPVPPPFVRQGKPFGKIYSVKPELKWIKKEEDAKQFLETEKDLTVIAEYVKSVQVVYSKFPGLHVHIGNIAQHASLEQLPTIVQTWADDPSKIRNLFSHLFDQMKEDPAHLDLYKQKITIALKTLSHDQLMNILYIYPIETQQYYQRIANEIYDIPLESFIQSKEEFKLSVEFIDGCQKVLEYGASIQDNVKSEDMLDG